MSSSTGLCAPNSFVYNETDCFCNPGYLLNREVNRCLLFSIPAAEAAPILNPGIGQTDEFTFPATLFAFDSIKKFTQSQAVFLEATLGMILSWLIFCFFLRLRKLEAEKTFWFRLRWWISRLDVCYATLHWLDDQKVVRKRKTELGGTLSVASWMLFIGLFAALLYQMISRRTIEVHNVRAANAPDLDSFINDMEFNITTISSMSCSHLRGLDTISISSPGFINPKVSPLSVFANYSCHNTSKGPTITLNCRDCSLIRDPVSISWQFVDLLNDPAAAVGFQFNLTARNSFFPRHISSLSGMLQSNRSNDRNIPSTFRGRDPNVLMFNLFPRIYHNIHGMKLVQPLFYDFLPGSSFSGVNKLQASLGKSSEGVVNTTLYINPLSSYILEIRNQNILGPVAFIADVGGLYCFSVCIFLYFLVQCEFRVKKLRNEDAHMRGIRNRRKAQERWGKLRKYVMYRWGSSRQEDMPNTTKMDICCPKLKAGTHHGAAFSLNKAVRNQVSLVDKCDVLPQPPLIEHGPEVSLSEVEKNVKVLQEYYDVLRDRLAHTQSMVQALRMKESEADNRVGAELW